MKKYKLGIFAEYFAAMLYMLRFYSILHHRMKTYVGEIDLVASKFSQLVFIEVKARKCGIYDGIVSNSQQERIRRAAELFLSKNAKYQNYDVRFDLVVIRPYKVPLIIRNA
ncbi:YraN family protein [Rickettsiaceae bacterium]|nr:YraN family protein [Rickettsiaceae bacterium]